jgi:ABC-type tungstate transport system permease subunit
VRFLSRYDKSANNIKESAIWAAIGQTPWSHPYSTWYHKYVEFPFQALRAASDLGEYTLTDRGTWFAIEGEVRERMMVFVSAISVLRYSRRVVGFGCSIMGRRPRSYDVMGADGLVESGRR